MDESRADVLARFPDALVAPALYFTTALPLAHVTAPTLLGC